MGDLAVSDMCDSSLKHKS